MCKNAKTKKQYVVPCYLWLLVFSPSFFGNLSHMVQNLYSERELSIKLLLGEKTKKKHFTISGYTYIHKTNICQLFFPFFLCTFPLDEQMPVAVYQIQLCQFFLLFFRTMALLPSHPRHARTTADSAVWCIGWPALNIHHCDVKFRVCTLYTIQYTKSYYHTLQIEPQLLLKMHCAVLDQMWFMRCAIILAKAVLCRTEAVVLQLLDVQQQRSVSRRPRFTEPVRYTATSHRPGLRW